MAGASELGTWLLSILHIYMFWFYNHFQLEKLKAAYCAVFWGKPMSMF